LDDLEIKAVISADVGNALQGFNQVSRAANGLSSKFDNLNKVATVAGASIGALGFAAIKFGKGAFNAAARVREMDVAISAIGISSGVGAEKIRSETLAIKKMGIEMSAAQNMAVTFAQGGLDIANASKIARVAQDLAVISQKNSTDTAMTLTRAIQTGNSMLLKAAGVTKMVSEGYVIYAKQIGKTVHTLNAQERQQSTANLIMLEGAKVAGVYEAAMKEPGKVMRSFPRLFDDINVAIGAALVKGFGPIILGAYDMVKAFDKAVSSGGQFEPIIKVIGDVLTTLLQPLGDAIKYFGTLIDRFKDTKFDLDGVKEKFLEFAPVIMAVATGLSALSAKSLLGQLPFGLGRLMGGLNPVLIGFTVLIALTPKLREPLMRLAKALATLLPVFLGIGGVLVALATQMIDDFIAPLVDTIVNLLVPTIETIGGALTTFGNFLKDSKTAQDLLTYAVGGFVGALTALKIVAGLVWVQTKLMAFWSGVLTVATFVLIAATDGFAAALLAAGIAANTIPFVPLITALGLLIGVFVTWLVQSGDALGKLKTIWNAIVTGIQYTVNFFLRGISEIVNAFLGLINKMITAWNAVSWGKDVQHLELTAYALDLTAAKFDKATKAKENYLSKHLGTTKSSDMDMYTPPKGGGGGGGGGDDKPVDKKKEALKKQMAELRKQITDTYKNAIGEAKNRLESIKQRQEEFAKSISETIQNTVSMSDAFATESKRIQEQRDLYDGLKDTVTKAFDAMVNYQSIISSQEGAANAVAQATKKQTELTAELGEEQETLTALYGLYNKTRVRADRVIIYEEIEKQTKKVSQAQEKLTETTDAVTAAQKDATNAGKSFQEGLQIQVKEASEFGAKLAKLAQLGLNEASFKEVLSAGAKVGGQIADELILGGVDAIKNTNDLQKQLTDMTAEVGKGVADKFYDLGSISGLNIVDALTKSAEKTDKFGKKINELLAMKLNATSLQQVLAAGVDAGTVIADNLIAGGSDAIAASNKIEADLKLMADNVGKNAATNYYQAGVDFATALVKGLKETWAALKPTLEDMTLPELKKTLGEAKDDTKKVTTPGPDIPPPVMSTPPVPSTPSPIDYGFGYGGLTGVPMAGGGKTRADVVAQFLTAVNAQFKQKWTSLSGFYNATGIKGMADKSSRVTRWNEYAAKNGVPMRFGGIVKASRGGTLARIGEGGSDEAVIPLNRNIMSQMGGNNYTLNITAGMGADGFQLGETIVDALIAYERRNGKIPLRTNR